MRRLDSPKQASWLGSCRPSQGAPTECPQAHEGPWAGQPSCNVPDPSTSPALQSPSPRPTLTASHPSLQHHPGSPRLLTLPLGKARAGARVPRLAEGSAWCPGAQGDPGVSWSPLGLHLQPASVTPQLAESGASILWLAVLGWPVTCPCHILVRPRVLSTQGTHGPRLAPPASLSPRPLGSFSRPVGALRTDSAGGQLPWQGRSPTSVTAV